MKVVINKCYGGFGLSDRALERYNELAGTELEHYYDIERTDAILVQVVTELGESANGDFAELKVIEIPDDVSWEINEYDGQEQIRECYRSWS